MVFSKLKLLPLLTALFNEIIISDKVYEEVVIKGLRIGKEDALIAKRFFKIYNEKFKIISTDNIDFIKNDKLDAGERSVIELAVKLNPDYVIIDEGKARCESRKLGLKVKGSAGIFVLAYKKKIIQYQELKRKGG